MIFLQYTYISWKKKTRILWNRKCAVLCKRVVDKPGDYQKSGLDRRTSQTDSLFPSNLFLFILSSVIVGLLFFFFLNQNEAIVWILYFNKLEISLSKSNLTFHHHQNNPLA